MPECIFNIASYATRIVRESPILIKVGRTVYHDYRTRQDCLAPSCWTRPGWPCPALPAGADVAAVSTARHALARARRPGPTRLAHDGIARIYGACAGSSGSALTGPGMAAWSGIACGGQGGAAWSGTACNGLDVDAWSGTACNDPDVVAWSGTACNGPDVVWHCRHGSGRGCLVWHCMQWPGCGMALRAMAWTRLSGLARHAVAQTRPPGQALRAVGAAWLGTVCNGHAHGRPVWRGMCCLGRDGLVRHCTHQPGCDGLSRMALTSPDVAA